MLIHILLGFLTFWLIIAASCLAFYFFIAWPFAIIGLYRFRLLFYQERISAFESLRISSIALLDELPEASGYGLDNTNVFMVPDLCSVGVVIGVSAEKSAIIISNGLSRTPDFKKFIIAHEAGHKLMLISSRSSFLYIIRSCRRTTRKEIECDHFASKILGTQKAISGLEALRLVAVLVDVPGVQPENNLTRTELDIRIMSLHLPTLFRQYA